MDFAEAVDHPRQETTLPEWDNLTFPPPLIPYVLSPQYSSPRTQAKVQGAALQVFKAGRIPTPPSRYSVESASPGSAKGSLGCVTVPEGLMSPLSTPYSQGTSLSVAEWTDEDVIEEQRQMVWFLKQTLEKEREKSLQASSEALKWSDKVGQLARKNGEVRCHIREAKEEYNQLLKAVEDVEEEAVQKEDFIRQMMSEQEIVMVLIQQLQEGSGNNAKSEVDAILKPPKLAQERKQVLPIANTVPSKPREKPESVTEHPEFTKYVTTLQSLVRAAKARKKVKMLRQRSNVLDELLRTEHTYSESLKIMDEVYMNPLLVRAESPRPILDSSQISAIFSNVRMLRAVSNLIVVELEERMVGNASIGAIFSDMAPLFPVYTEYVNNYNSALASLSTHNQNQLFQQYLEACGRDQNAKGNQLQSLLIVPIQRIPRYQLLLQEMLKFTPDDDPHLGSLQKAMDTILSLANLINEARRQHENMEKIAQIQARLEQAPLNLIAPHRRFIREARMVKRGLERVFFLFNDVLVYAKKSFMGLIYKGFIDLSRAHVTVPPGGGEGEFVINTPSKSYPINAGTATERMGWVDDIQRQVASIQTKFDKRGMSVFNIRQSLEETYKEIIQAKEKKVEVDGEITDRIKGLANLHSRIVRFTVEMDNLGKKCYAAQKSGDDENFQKIRSTMLALRAKLADDAASKKRLRGEIEEFMVTLSEMNEILKVKVRQYEDDSLMGFIIFTTEKDFRAVAEATDLQAAMSLRARTSGSSCQLLCAEDDERLRKTYFLGF